MDQFVGSDFITNDYNILKSFFIKYKKKIMMN